MHDRLRSLAFFLTLALAACSGNAAALPTDSAVQSSSLANGAAAQGAAQTTGPVSSQSVTLQQTAPQPTLEEAEAAARAHDTERHTLASGDYDVLPNIVVAIGYAAFDTSRSPNGANTGCTPSTQHPYPLVLVNGTFSSMEDDFGALAPALANAGYCVFAFDYGAPSSQLIQSIGPIASSANALANFVTSVLAKTGASKVDLVGHSQGGMLTEYYAKVLGGAPHIHDIVALSPTSHGTTLDGLTSLAKTFPGANALVAAACQACADQEIGSAALAPLDAGPIAQSGVTYTIIETRDEIVVTPVGSSFVHDPGVTNEYVQDACPFDPVDHVDLPYDQAVFTEVLSALDPSHPHTPNCFTAFPYPA